MKQGNFMRKGRTNISLSLMGREILQKLMDEEGVSGSDVIERLVRAEHDRIFGRENRPKLRPLIKSA